jgi:hypothetical protein
MLHIRQSRSSLSKRLRRGNKSRKLELISRLLKQHCLDLSDSGRVIGECWGLVGPRQIFGETLVSFEGFGPILDFNTLVEVGAPRWS